MQGIVLSALCVLIHVVLTTALWDTCLCYPQLSDEQPEAQSIK